MSLDGFHAGLAALVADPDLVRAARRGDTAWLEGRDLTEREVRRLVLMAGDARMAVLCSLYRSNRLTALVRTVPSVVLALGDRLSQTVTELWRAQPRTDMQFRTEAAELCAFVRERWPDDAALAEIVDAAEADLARRYDGAPAAAPAARAT